VFFAPKKVGVRGQKKKKTKRERTSVVFPDYRSKEQPFSESVRRRREHKEISYHMTYLSCELFRFTPCKSQPFPGLEESEGLILFRAKIAV